MLLASSSSVYGEADTPWTEYAPQLPQSWYAITKHTCELLWEQHKDDSKSCLFSVVRLFSVYGPNGRPDMAPQVLPIHIYLFLIHL